MAELSRFDANLVAHYGRGQLWVGAAPPAGAMLRKAGFTALALCAHEHQPSPESYPGMSILYAPLDDSGVPPEQSEMEMAVGASRKVARWVREGHKVLVSCWQGRNRSGLISALALMRLTGARGRDAAMRVAMARPGALQNPYFVAFLQSKTTRRALLNKA